MGLIHLCIPNIWLGPQHTAAEQNEWVDGYVNESHQPNQKHGEVGSGVVELVGWDFLECTLPFFLHP
jgi:hypothetical protein